MLGGLDTGSKAMKDNLKDMKTIKANNRARILEAMFTVSLCMNRPERSSSSNHHIMPRLFVALSTTANVDLFMNLSYEDCSTRSHYQHGIPSPHTSRPFSNAEVGMIVEET